MPPLDEFESQIPQAMIANRQRLRNVLGGIQAAVGKGRPVDRQRLAGLEKDLRQSVGRCAARRKAVPKFSFDPDLPISARREEIAAAIRNHQVAIVCGETGSGKSTQLPKICLEMGRGVAGLIGHTQPRRIAARSVAARIAKEIGSPLGRDVGYKVRFSESIGPNSYIKLMTDGILLAETQSNPYFEQYDTIILDEAHERSLNVDFLIGYLKRLLPKRPDLRLIITSATIDAARFAEHFATATRDPQANHCRPCKHGARAVPAPVPRRRRWSRSRGGPTRSKSCGGRWRRMKTATSPTCRMPCGRRSRKRHASIAATC